MEAYFVRVLMDNTVGEVEERGLSIWIVRADNADEAMQIVAKRAGEGHQIQGANKAPAGTAERYKLAVGQARRL
jgi:hypothetical protein